MIPTKDFADHIDDLERGETKRVNHTNCTAGEDTRRRLYLTRPASSPALVVAYCHNCTDKGVFHGEGHTSYRRDKDLTIVVPDKQVPFAPPNHMEPDPSLWPGEATVWRIEKKLSKAQCQRACIQYDPSTHRIFLPQYDIVNGSGSPRHGTELLGYQLRSIDGLGAKYLSAQKDGEVKPYTRIRAGAHQRIILVEDLASGLAVARATMHSVLVNYGVKVVPETLYKNINCDKFIVWLDNDSPHVKDQAIHISRTWAMIHGKEHRTIDRYDDPKNYNEDDIRGILNDG